MFFFEFQSRISIKSGGVLGRLGEVLEASWGVLGASWGRLGASWGRLGGVLWRLGASWETTCPQDVGPFGLKQGSLEIAFAAEYPGPQDSYFLR